MESITPILGGIAGIILACAGFVTASRRSTQEVSRENGRLRRQIAVARLALDQAEIVIYKLRGVARRGEPDTDDIDRSFAVYQALTDRLDNGEDSKETGAGV